MASLNMSVFCNAFLTIKTILYTILSVDDDCLECHLCVSLLPYKIEASTPGYP
jgi:hypothetical protein